MAEQEPQANGNGFTNKEMWVRVDAKLDTLVAKQQYFDVELALQKERQHQLELEIQKVMTTEEEARRHAESDRGRIAKNLEDSEAEMRRRVEELVEGQQSIMVKQRVTAMLVGAAVVIVNVAVAVFSVINSK